MKALIARVKCLVALVYAAIFGRTVPQEPAMNPLAQPIATDLAEFKANIETNASAIKRYATRALKNDGFGPDGVRWHFRSTILARLDDYFKCLRRLRRYRPDDCDLLARVGFTIPADAFINGSHQSSVSLNGRTLPGFGGVLFPWSGPSDEDDNCYPSLIYFRKIAYPSGVETFRGDVYCLTGFYDDRRRLHVPMTMHIGVSADGTTRLLRERAFRVSTIQPRKKNSGRRPSSFEVKTLHWEYPSWAIDLCFEKGRFDIDAWATSLFRMVILTHLESLQKIIVRASLNGCIASFGIDVQRGKYFFADRECDAAADGKRKRIFHYVQQHKRQLALRDTTVKPHYRGLRHFDWNSYGVDIVMPKNNFAYDMPLAAEEVDSPVVPSSFVSSKQLGQKLAELAEA